LDVTRFAIFAVPVRFIEVPARNPTKFEVPATFRVESDKGPL
jgi:hypothetical protein